MRAARMSEYKPYGLCSLLYPMHTVLSCCITGNTACMRGRVRN